MKIYTKTGDNGNTSLYGGKRTSKAQKVFEVLGTLDELNSTLGFIHSFRQKKIKGMVLEIQNDLFEFGSYIAGKEFLKTDERRWSKKVEEIESLIDKYEAENQPLRNFILPGGSQLSSHLHFSRAVCRRLERQLVSMSKNLSNKKGLKTFQIYTNRLSDLLFVIARYVNKKEGIKDIIWKSGR